MAYLTNVNCTLTLNKINFKFFLNHLNKIRIGFNRLRMALNIVYLFPRNNLFCSKKYP